VWEWDVVKKIVMVLTSRMISWFAGFNSFFSAGYCMID
jgi:hypothetical protein